MALVNYSKANASSMFTWRLNGDTTTVYDSYGLNLTGRTSYDKSNFNIFSEQVGSSIRMGQQSVSASDYSMGAITFSGCNATGFKAFQSLGAGQSDAGAGGETYIMQGVYRGTSTISSISLISSNGNFNNGTLWVYTSA
jgi:hypothetical protein